VGASGPSARAQRRRRATADGTAEHPRRDSWTLTKPPAIALHVGMLRQTLRFSRSATSRFHASAGGKHVADLARIDSDFTVVRRVQELYDAIRVMAPDRVWGWLRQIYNARVASRFATSGCGCSRRGSSSSSAKR